MTSTDVAVAELRDQAVAYLGSDRRLAFLAELVHEVSLAARRGYPPQESEAYRVAGGFICHNELLHVVGNQLRADYGRYQGYPSREFVATLVGTAKKRGCEAGLRSALAGAVSVMEQHGQAVPPTTAPGGFERVMEYLASTHRPAFLAELVYWISLEARGLYPPPDTAAYRAAAVFICHNEQFQVLASQLRTDLGGWGRGYPSPALVEALIGKARLWGCEAGVRDALARALAAASET